MERIGRQTIPQSNLWREVQVQGERLQEAVVKQRTRVSPERIILESSDQDHQTPQGISMDGGMVNIRGEGWKEMKVGTVYTIGTAQHEAPLTGETVDLPAAETTYYTAVLGNVAQFSTALWALAVQHRIPQAARTSVTADGAEWIWNLANDLFPDSTQIVDWYHAMQHLAQAAHALFPDDDDHARRWFRRMKTPLFRGEIFKITTVLNDHGLSDHARYFDRHQRRMHYQQFRADDCLIGSGTVESAIKQFKVRLTGPGMRWERANADRMLVIRSAILSNEFDALWDAA